MVQGSTSGEGADEDPQAWAQRRTEAAASQAARLQRAEHRENEAAAALLEDFARAAGAAGLRPEPLRARDLSGRGSYRTDVSGWYLRRDRSAAVDEQGRFYLLRTTGGLLGHLRGVRLEPSPAPLVLGRGGRDGDSVDLVEALDRLLPPEGLP